MEEPEMNIDLVAEILRTLDELVKRVEAIEAAMRDRRGTADLGTAGPPVGGAGDFTVTWNNDSLFRQ